MSIKDLIDYANENPVIRQIKDELFVLDYNVKIAGNFMNDFTKDGVMNK